MRTFAQKPNTTQQPRSATRATLNRALSRQSHQVQAVQPTSQSNAELREEGLSGEVSRRLGHDFGRIPIHLPVAAAIQTKLAVSETGDDYEEEADRISEQVMRTPEPPLQRACACGGGCPRCQTIQLSQNQEHLQTRRVRKNDIGGTEAPAIVHEVLNSPGQPLDTDTRDFMEPRFGHDFSHVRVHANQAAAEAALAVNSLAFTAGNHIVFAGGHYAPTTRPGRALLAHELTHTLQQVQTTNVAYHVLQRSADSQQPALPQPRSSIRSQPLPEGPGRAAGISVYVRQRGSNDDIAVASGVAANRTSTALIEVLSVVELGNALNQLTGPSRCVRHLTIWNHGSPHGQLLGLRIGREGFTSQWLLNPSENLDSLNLLRHSFCCGAHMTWLGCSTAGVIAHGGRRTEEELRTIRQYGLDPNEYPSIEDAEAHGAIVFGFGSGRVNVQSWANATCATIEVANRPTIWNPRTMQGSYGLLPGGRFLRVGQQGGDQCACNASTGRVNPLSRTQLGTAIEPIAHVFFTTLRDIAGEITLPPGLPFISPERAHFVPRPTDSAEPAEAQPWRLFCEPLDPWSWIIFTPNIILHTRQRTRAVMEHELEHCADFHRSLIRFRDERWRRRNAGERLPDEPSAPADVCSITHEPPEQQSVTGFWRFYYDWWHSFENSEDPQRHLQIYEQERLGNEFESWSSAERQDWLEAALSDAMPTAAIPPTHLLPIELSVNARFQSGTDGRKTAYLNSFNRAIEHLCYTRSGARLGQTPHALHDNHVRLWNIYSHFEPIHRWWASHDRVMWSLNWQRTRQTAYSTWTEQNLGRPRFAGQ